MPGWLGFIARGDVEYILLSWIRSYKEQASRMVGELMVRQIRSIRQCGIREQRRCLQLEEPGYHLVILSNCKASYREAHWKEFGMERLFELFYDCESYGFRPRQKLCRNHPGIYRPLIWWSETGGRI